MKIISRKIAKGLGLTRFFDGEPCHAGHVAERMVYNNQCTECRRIARLTWRIRHREEVRAKGREYHRNRREQCVQALGGKCECCGEHDPVFLNIDHIGGGGNEHRRIFGQKNSSGTPARFYGWLLTEIKSGRLYDIRKQFRILCWNCNAAYSVLGYCPHKGRYHG